MSTNNACSLDAIAVLGVVASTGVYLCPDTRIRKPARHRLSPGCWLPPAAPGLLMTQLTAMALEIGLVCAV